MRRWQSVGRRPLRPVHSTPSFHLCPPCRLLSFSHPTRAASRHSARHIHDKNHIRKNGGQSSTTTLFRPLDPTPVPSSDASKAPATSELARRLAALEDEVAEQNERDLKILSENNIVPSASFSDVSRSFNYPNDAHNKSDDGSDATLWNSDNDAIQTLKEAMTQLKQHDSSKGMTRRKRMGIRPHFVQTAIEETPERLDRKAGERDKDLKRAAKYLSGDLQTLTAGDTQLERLFVPQPSVPRLAHGLDRVLFNHGVYQLQDPHSKVYNFNPYLQKIMPVTEFDYDALSQYQTSSQDNFLKNFAREQGKKYVGSTSSMTSTLMHFHYLLSAWRPLNIGMFSKDFPDTLQSFTALNRAPNAIFLRWKNGTYAIDADKEYDDANVLMLLGRSMEKLMTMSVPEFEQYRKGNSQSIAAAQRAKPESYNYSAHGDFLLRSQLDAYDPRLPGTGMFDLKTRAVLSVRMQASDYEEMSGYEISSHQGQYESYEREHYDMMRSTALKYSLQARMGRMDGIFLAYHNVERIFGFRYMSLNEMDQALHGQSSRFLGNREFSLSLDLLNKVFDKAIEKFPGQSLRFHFETRPVQTSPYMYIFVEPMSEEGIDEIQNSQKEKVRELERTLRGLELESEKEAAATDEKSSEIAASNTQVKDETGQSSREAADVEAEKTETVDASQEESARNSVIDSDGEEIQESLEDSEVSEASGADSTEASKPLLGMVLSVRQRVNTIPVERPENLRPGDEWEIDYTLTEMKQREASNLYKMVKRRREKALSQDSFRSPSSEAHNDAYVSMLRDLSRKGRKMRKNLDRDESEAKKVVVGSPYHGDMENTGKGSKKSHDDSEDIAGVQDYMKWLFTDKSFDKSTK